MQERSPPSASERDALRRVLEGALGLWDATLLLLEDEAQTAADPYSFDVLLQSLVRLSCCSPPDPRLTHLRLTESRDVGLHRFVRSRSQAQHHLGRNRQRSVQGQGRDAPVWRHRVLAGSRPRVRSFGPVAVRDTHPLVAQIPGFGASVGQGRPPVHPLAERRFRAGSRSFSLRHVAHCIKGLRFVDLCELAASEHWACF